MSFISKQMNVLICTVDSCEKKTGTEQGAWVIKGTVRRGEIVVGVFEKNALLPIQQGEPINPFDIFDYEIKPPNAT